MHKYLVVFEKTKNGYSAYSPDLKGCIATGSTKKQAEKNIYEAIEMHIAGMIEDNIKLPTSTAYSEYILLNEKAISGN